MKPAVDFILEDYNDSILRADLKPAVDLNFEEKRTMKYVQRWDLKPAAD